MSLQNLVAIYLDDCKARSLSARTITNDYGHVLSLLTEGLDHPDANAITTHDLRQYIVRLGERDKYSEGHHPWMVAREGEHLSKWTLRGHVKTIKTFFRWAADSRYIESDPAAALGYPRTPKGRVEVFSDAEVLALLQAASDASFRDYAIVLLMLDTGLRRSEVCDLTTTHINVTSGIVDVAHGKGDKYRRVPFGYECQKAQWRYNAQYRKPRTGVDAFYVNDEGGPLTYDALGMIFKRLDAKLTFRVFPHKCRHTWGTNLARQGRSAFEIAHLGGWTTTDTAMLYVHIAQREVINASPMDQVLGKRKRT